MSDLSTVPNDSAERQIGYSQLLITFAKINTNELPEGKTIQEAVADFVVDCVSTRRPDNYSYLLIKIAQKFPNELSNTLNYFRETNEPAFLLLKTLLHYLLEDTTTFQPLRQVIEGILACAPVDSRTTEN